MMDMSSTSWYSELGTDDPIFFDHSEMLECFDEELAAALGEDDFPISLSSESNSSSSTLIPNSSSTATAALCVSSAFEPPPHQVGVDQRPAKQLKPSNYNSNSVIHTKSSLDQASSSPIILSFGNSNALQNAKIGAFNNPEDEAVSDVLMSQTSFANLDEATRSSQPFTKKSNSRSRPPSQTYDHIIAERKRREQLSQRFVALSAIVPGLKKMDKTSVLGDAIKYLKQLQERVKTLEEKATQQIMESVVLVKKSQIVVEDEGSSDENYGRSSNESLPEIEARVCNQQVLIRIHCEKQKSVLVKVLSEVEKLNLTVFNTSVSSFGTMVLDITIIAEIEREYTLTAKELVKSLRSVLQRVS